MRRTHAVVVLLASIAGGCSDDEVSSPGAADGSSDGIVGADTGADSTMLDTGTVDAAAEADGPYVIGPDAPPDTFVDTSSVDVPMDDKNKVVFITSATYTGDLGGIAGADAKCQALATAASLSGTFRAWVATNSSAPAFTFTRTSGDYVLPDGTIVAHGWSGLSSGKLLHAIDMTESKAGAPSLLPTLCGAGDATTGAWTGTREDGVSIVPASGTANCDGWTATTGGAVWGWAGTTNGWWSYRCQSSSGCDAHASLYCVEQ